MDDHHTNWTWCHSCSPKHILSYVPFSSLYFSPRAFLAQERCCEVFRYLQVCIKSECRIRESDQGTPLRYVFICATISWCWHIGYFLQDALLGYLDCRLYAHLEHPLATSHHVLMASSCARNRRKITTPKSKHSSSHQSWVVMSKCEFLCGYWCKPQAWYANSKTICQCCPVTIWI